jgi:hypothetical protein
LLDLTDPPWTGRSAATERLFMAEGTSRTPGIGYRAYLLQDGDKFVVAVPALEYDPNVPHLSDSQVRGIAEIRTQFETHQALGTKVVPIHFDPSRLGGNTSVVQTPPPPPPNYPPPGGRGD